MENIPKKDPNIKPTKSNADKAKYYKLNNVEYVEVGIREAMKSVAVGLGEGYVRCHCGGKCVTNRCGCYQSKIGCNTKFHPQSSKCENNKDRMEEVEPDPSSESSEEN